MKTADAFFIIDVINYPPHTQRTENPDRDIRALPAAPGCFGGKLIHIRKRLLYLLLYLSYSSHEPLTAECLVVLAREHIGYRWNITRVKEALNWFEQVGFLIFDGEEVTIDLAPLSVDHRAVTIAKPAVPEPKMSLADTAAEVKADRIRAHGLGIRW